MAGLHRYIPPSRDPVLRAVVPGVTIKAKDVPKGTTKLLTDAGKKIKVTRRSVMVIDACTDFDEQ